MQHAIYRRQVATASGLDILAGIWLLISPWVLGFSLVHAPTTNDVILGIVIGVIACIRFFGAYGQAWLSWINAILGVWVLITPWVLGFARYRVPTTNNIIMGIIVIILASWSAMATSADHGDVPQNRM